MNAFHTLEVGGMSPNIWLTSLRSSMRTTKPTTDKSGRPKKREYRPNVESLEDRTLLATINWINPGSGLFDVGSNWSGGVVPGANDVAVIDTGGTAATITIQNGDTIQVQGI